MTAPTSGAADGLIRRTAAELADLLGRREVSAVQVTRAHLDRIAAVDGERDDAGRATGRGVHAFLHVAAERALGDARSVDDARAAGETLHPLAGVPIAVKDVMATQGLPTTCGSRILRGWVPPYDATVVRRIRDAGLVVLGKTNMDEFAMGSSTEHSAYGPTRNPWDLDRIPGGSGGGSAAALAAFEAPLATGTDTGGSASPPRSPARSGSSPPTVPSPGTAWSPWPAAWTRPARAPGPCWTPHCCTR
jgi:aspartyl-tRNA(Asn)/glutamyl-tRNA(Gln) amidotransferase subunit A